MNRFSVYSLATFLLFSFFLFQCKKDIPIVLPVVTLSAVSNLTATAASAGGKVSADGGSAVTAKGVCWSSTNTSPTTSDSNTSDGRGIGDFSSTITGLKPGTTYTLRAYATNAVGIAYSDNVLTFKTLALAPTIISTEVSKVNSSSFRSGGNIIDDGGSPVTARGVCWGATTGPTIDNTKTLDGTGTGIFTSAITGLKPGTTYYARAYATNREGTSYGNEMSFKTLVSETVAGGNGNGPAANQLNYPTSVFVDASGNIYVADGGNSRIQKWSPGASSGTTVAGGNGPGTAANQLYSPQDIFVDASGNIYVADYFNSRIQKWSPGASSGTTVAMGKETFNAANQIPGKPVAVFVDASGNIYVADLWDRIQKWSPGASIGTTVAGGNGQGSATNQLSNPSSIFVDASGNIYVADSDNARIQKWSPGSSSGTTVAGGNGQGSAANQLNNPTSVFVDASGNIYVADYFNSRIQKWSPGSSSGTTVAGGNGQGSATNQISGAVGVFVDASGNIYVAEQSNHRIQKWVKP